MSHVPGCGDVRDGAVGAVLAGLQGGEALPTSTHAGHAGRVHHQVRGPERQPHTELEISPG